MLLIAVIFIFPHYNIQTYSIKDWTYLCTSDYHSQVSVYPAPGMSDLDTEVSAGIMDESGPAAELDPSALLFTHIPALFYVLHLLYEDLKLDELQRSGARALVGLLQQMARYLNLHRNNY